MKCLQHCSLRRVIGLQRQIPNPTPGVKHAVGDSATGARASTSGFQFFPAAPPPLMPYLASQDDYGNTALRPGALFFFVPLEGVVQGGKYWLSDYGFRYSLQQTITYVSMTRREERGQQSGILHPRSQVEVDHFRRRPTPAPPAGSAPRFRPRPALIPPAATQSAKSNLGTVTDPTGIWSDVNGCPGAGTGLAAVRSPRRICRGRGHGQPAQLY